MLTIREDSLTLCAVWAESALCSQSQRVRLLSCPDTRPDGTNTDTHTRTFAYGQTDTARSTRSPRSRSFDFTRCLRVVHSKSRSQVLCLVQAVRSLAYVCVCLLCQICERTGHKQTHIHRRSNRLGQFFTVSVLSGFRLHNVSWRCQQQEHFSVAAQVECLREHLV